MNAVKRRLAAAALAVLLAGGVTGCGGEADPAVTRANYLIESDRHLDRLNRLNADLDFDDDGRMSDAEKADLYEERAALNRELAQLSRWKCPAVAEGYTEAADALTYLAAFNRAIDQPSLAARTAALNEWEMPRTWVYLAAGRMLDDERVTADCWSR